MERKPNSGGNRAQAVNRRPESASRRASSYSSSASSRAGSRRPQQRPVYGRPPVNHRPQRRPARRKSKLRFEFNRTNLILIACLAVVLAIVIFIGSAWITTAVNRSTFCSGVYIDNVDMTNYTRENGERVIRSMLEDRLNASYTLSGAGFNYTFTPSDFCTGSDVDVILERAWNIGHVGSIFDCSNSIRQLREQPVYLEIAVQRDEDAENAFIDKIYNDVYIAPQDAQVVVDLTAPQLTGQSEPGREVDRETLRGQIDALLVSGETSFTLPIIELSPTLSSEQAASAMDPIVEFSTDVSFRTYNSRYNVRKALSCFNGFCVHPGETVSFNEIVGERSENNGWMEATEYAANNSVKGFGGGVCQASSTLYNAVIRALGYESIITRNPHSMTVTYLDPGLDAAVTNTNKNFIFQNPTDTPIYIFTEVTRENATVRIYGKRPPNRYDLVSVIIRQDRKAEHKGYVYDTEGKHCFFVTDTPVLYKEGHPACDCQSWLIAYDWDTGEEQWRKQVGNDSYDSGTDIYWVGVHAPDGTALVS